MRKFDQRGNLTAIVCNRCGKITYVHCDLCQEEYLHVKKEWGYFSEYDGEIHEFDICKDCYKIFMDEWKVPFVVTERTEYL